MISSMLLCVGMLAATGDEGPSTGNRATVLSDYQKASKEAGRDAKAHIRLALWCESHGMSAERMKHLAMAVLYDPANGLARGLMGLVAYQGAWAQPDEVSRRVKTDPAMAARLAEYNARRDRVPHTAEAHWKLALWCEEVGLRPEAKAHLATVTQLDPARDAAWKRLGFKKKVDGRWMTEAQIAAEKARARAQKQADDHWKPLLARWSGWLLGKDKVRKYEAEAAFSRVNDPGAVRPVWSVLVAGGVEPLQAKAVQVLAQIDAPAASRALAMLSVFGRSREVRRSAVEALKRRDPRDFLGLLVALVRDPLKYEVRPGATPNSVGQLFVEGQRYDVNRNYNIEENVYNRIAALPPRSFDPSVPFDPFGAQNLAIFLGAGSWGTPMGALPQSAARARQQATINREIWNQEAMAVQQDMLIARRIMAVQQIADVSRMQLLQDIEVIEAYNADASAVDDLAIPVLTELSGRDLGASAESWQAWWTDQRGYAYSTQSPDTKPTYTEFVLNPIAMNHSCFGAGTPVHTLDGPRAIDSIRVGDRVLSQDARTGKLAFTAVMAVFHNKPAATLRIAIADATIVATGIHRFWKAGSGWCMARDLRPGDTLRVLEGTAPVVSVEKDSVQPVFNLEVAEGHSFFVGDLGALVHDNSLVDPIRDPFDAVPSLAARSASGH